MGNPFGFAGGWLVSGNYQISSTWRSVKQLWYFWNRHYEPEYLLRWLQPDPIGPWGDRNGRGSQFSYTAGRPLSGVDRTGKAVGLTITSGSAIFWKNQGSTFAGARFQAHFTIDPGLVALGYRLVNFVYTEVFYVCCDWRRAKTKDVYIETFKDAAGIDNHGPGFNLKIDDGRFSRCGNAPRGYLMQRAVFSFLAKPRHLDANYALWLTIDYMGGGWGAGYDSGGYLPGMKTYSKSSKQPGRVGGMVKNHLTGGVRRYVEVDDIVDMNSMIPESMTKWSWRYEARWSCSECYNQRVTPAPVFESLDVYGLPGSPMSVSREETD